MKAVILAAGKSLRFWPLNQRHKSLIKIMGKPLIWYTLDSLRKAGIKDLIIVQASQKDIEKELKNYSFPNLKIKYLIQPEPKGMGNALWQAKDFLKEPFFVLNAERIDGGEIIENVKFKLKSLKCKAILTGERTQTPQLFGIMKLRGDKILDIIEKPRKDKAPSNVRIIGVYLLEPSFFEIYQKIKKNQYDFEKALSLYVKKNDVRVTVPPKKTLPLKYPWHLFEVKKYLFDKFLRKKIEKNVQIAKNVTIEGKVYIGKGTKIFEGAKIKGPCYIGENCTIGNNALIRDYSNLEDDVLVGAVAEVKNSIFQKNCHTHSGFFGDSIFGQGCRVGAGTITANVRIDRKEIRVKDRRKKISTKINYLGAIVGENTKIGINVSLMPGILIGSNCIIGPHSFVRENIGDEKIFYSKFNGITEKRS